MQLPQVKGDLFAWGKGENGQLGTGAYGRPTRFPVLTFELVCTRPRSEPELCEETHVSVGSEVGCPLSSNASEMRRPVLTKGPGYGRGLP